MLFISTTSQPQNGTAQPAGIFNFRTDLANQVRKRISSRVAKASPTDRFDSGDAVTQ